MAGKKRRRYKRNGKARRPITNNLDRHHLFWTKRKWERGIYQKLRMHPYCIVLIPRDTLHRYIHSRLCYIPTPRMDGVRFALGYLEAFERIEVISLDDPIEKRLSILAALFDYTDQPTADALRKQLKIVREFNNPP